MKYIRDKRNLQIILIENGRGILKWWIDGSSTVYPNMRGNTGGVLSIIRIFLIVSSKTNLNTRTSTETKIVAMDDYIHAILWTRHCLDAQGYYVFNTIIYQDNKSAIILENKGEASIFNHTKQMNIIYYFITDHYKNMNYQ